MTKWVRSPGKNPAVRRIVLQYRTDDPKYQVLEAVVQQFPYGKMNSTLLSLLEAACREQRAALASGQFSDPEDTAANTTEVAERVAGSAPGATSEAEETPARSSPEYGRTASNFFNN